MKVFSVIFFLISSLMVGFAQQVSDSTKTEIEVPAWFTILDTIDVSNLSENNVNQFFDTINYKIISQEQLGVLELKKIDFKRRYIAAHGKFPTIYPQANLYVANMHCGKCVKMVTKILNIESSVIRVLKVDSLDRIVTFYYDESLKGKEDEKLFPNLISKLEIYNYRGMSEEASTDPMLMENEELNLMYCPIHDEKPVETEEEESSIEEENSLPEEQKE